jgi:tRNA pseudouridine38-40 synthase
VRNIKVTIDYDGTDFSGFQKQPGRRTVQGELEFALGELFGEPIKVIGAGRTDAGVHATGQVISFLAGGTIPVDRICPAMNGALARDVRAKRAEAVADGFHARYSAKSRTYVYVVLNREMPSALLGRYTWRIGDPLDLADMRSASRPIIGVQDFASFGMPDRTGGSTIRQVFECRISRRRDLVLVRIRANAYLRGMARAIVGSLVEIGQRRRPAEGIAEILAALDRQAVRVTAPPQGLFLTRVEYQGEMDK